MPGPFTPLDLGLGLIALVSGLLAMYRGLTREVLSLLSWALAGVAGLFFVQYQKGLAQTIADKFFGGTLMLAQFAGASLIFLLVLIVVHLVTARISDHVLDSHVGIIDRLLGLAFGVGRGFLLVTIAFVFFTTFTGMTEDKKFPWWMKGSQSIPLIQEAGQPLDGLMQTMAEYLSTKLGKKTPGDQPSTPAEDAQGTNG